MPTAGTGRYLLLELAKKFHNSITLDNLKELASTHSLPIVRAKSYGSLSFLLIDEKIWQKALMDKDLTVYGHARLVLNSLL